MRSRSLSPVLAFALTGLLVAGSFGALSPASAAGPTVASDDGAPPAFLDFLPTGVLDPPRQVRADGAVFVEAIVDGPADLAQVAAAIAAFGEVVTVAPDYATVTAWVVPEAIETVASIPGVRSAITPPPPVIGSGTLSAGSTWNEIPAPSCRSVPTESDTPLGAAIARAQFGVDGSGVTVGIISDSFATAPVVDSTFEQDVLTGNLPGPGNPCGYSTPVEVLADAPEGDGSDEGRAMAQLVHGIAPGARLLFATGFDGALGMAENIRLLADAGADIIVDDVSYYSEPGYQVGAIGAAVEDVVADGVGYFSSAGNGSFTSDVTGRQIASWVTDEFAAVECPAAIGGDDGNTGCLDFGLDAPDVSNRITVERGEDGTFSVSVYGFWDEPWYGVEAPMAMFALTTDDDPTIVGAALCPDFDPTLEYACDRSWMAMTLTEASLGLPDDDVFDLDLVVMRSVVSGVAPEDMPVPGVRIQFSSSDGNMVAMEHDEGGTTTDGREVITGASLSVNNAAPGVFAVAAAGVQSPGTVERFSSFGPWRLSWDRLDSVPPGEPAEPLLEPWIREGPDATGIDGALTSFFGYQHRFFGTSASAPTVAAVAALLTEAVPSAGQSEIADALRNSAVAVEPQPGVDVDAAVGAGLVQTIGALEFLEADPAPLRVPVPAALVPASSADLRAAIAGSGVPVLEASIADGIATVRGLPHAARGSWVWVYAYSSPSTLGWLPVDAAGTVAIPVASLADGAHLLSFFRGDALIASSSLVLGGQQVLPATGASTAAAVAPDAALSALGFGALLLLVAGLRRSTTRRRASHRR